MRGSKVSDETKVKALEMLAMGNTASYVANKFGLKRTTVDTWKRNSKKKHPKVKEVEIQDEIDLEKIRQNKKIEFVNEAWDDIRLALSIVRRKLERASSKEELLDEMLQKAELGELSASKKSDMAKNIASMKIEDISKLMITIGTLYDKQALINKEATVNHGITEDFENALKKIEGSEF